MNLCRQFWTGVLSESHWSLSTGRNLQVLRYKVRERMLNATPEQRVALLAALWGAAALAAMSVVLGYGWPALIISTSLGAVVGYWSALRMLAKRRLPSDTSFQQLSRLQKRAPSNSTDSARGMLSCEIVPGSSLTETRPGILLRAPFQLLPKYQGRAAAIFLLQTIISFVAIVAFWMAQTAGLDVEPQQVVPG